MQLPDKANAVNCGDMVSQSGSRPFQISANTAIHRAIFLPILILKRIYSLSSYTGSTFRSSCLVPYGTYVRNFVCPFICGATLRWQPIVYPFCLTFDLCPGKAVPPFVVKMEKLDRIWPDRTEPQMPHVYSLGTSKQCLMTSAIPPRLALAVC